MFTNLLELIKSMPDEQTCREYIAVQRWGVGKVVCPYCEGQKAYVIEGGKRYKCADKTCLKKFSVTVGTFMEASNIPLTKWIAGIYLVTSSKKGISSYQLGRQLGIAQKNSWFMLHRIRQVVMPNNDEQLKDTIEADETYMARKYRSDFKGLPPDEVEYKLNHKHDNKGAVLGMVERNTGKVRLLAFANNNRDNITAAVRANVKKGSKLHTDESYLYRALEQEYYRETVVHGRKEWVRQSIVSGKVHTNNVENFWSVMKRGVHGIYHQISYKHLQAYCNEFAFRYNTREIKDHERFVLSLEGIKGRLTYKQLISEKESKEKDTRSYYRQNKP